MIEDIVYIVRVKSEFQLNFKDTTIRHKFAGKILAQIRDAYVFELNEAYGALVIIPFEWIECMAPSQIHFELKHKLIHFTGCEQCGEIYAKELGDCPRCEMRRKATGGKL